MTKKNSQLLNTILIVLGGGILIYTIANEEPHQLLQIFGFIIIMFGLYRATNHWVETKHDHKEEQEQQQNDL
ncbi:hypothetical protein LZ575_01565 [Antarcticibacterium sp. 1MA-6-2]|uniref:hypothetical protein n=1 Tax=Antarcticibacterium sp. 1MA-6-2 TaxID=2908210 RepID=UPI001F29124D|nr:hypothetical protein [Antarcticibacterium sp. 1MA-6-2]UJH91478.1 hypothetical protein LZ575_01565 [Antarcticibacterium sp. 1MA-6-2]